MTSIRCHSSEEPYVLSWFGRHGSSPVARARVENRVAAANVDVGSRQAVYPFSNPTLRNHWTAGAQLSTLFNKANDCRAWMELLSWFGQHGRYWLERVNKDHERGVVERSMAPLGAYGCLLTYCHIWPVGSVGSTGPMSTPAYP